MSKSGQIRCWLAANDGLWTRAEIAAAIGLDVPSMYSVLREMVKAGILVRDGERYGLGRPLRLREKGTRTAEDRRACDHASHARRRRRLGQVPRAEYLETLAATRAERQEATAARRAKARAATRVAAAAERAAQRQAEPERIKTDKRQQAAKPKTEYAKQLHRHVRAKVQPSVAEAFAPCQPQAQAESVEAFMARGGRVERLPPGAGTTLRFVGVEL